MNSLIMIAHGSKRKMSNDEFRLLVEKVKEKNSDKYDLIINSFLEFEQPCLNTAVKNCIEEGSSNITIYPFFLNSGKHVTHDIPNIIEDLKNIYPDVDFKILPHFGKSDDIVSIISSHI